MPIRNIVRIDEDKCNGCGKCVNACAEGAIKMIDGKARLVSETYCDGLGACLGSCPQDAITVEKREAEQFDEAAVKEHLDKSANKQTSENTDAAEKPFVCPGMAAMSFSDEQAEDDAADKEVKSQLRQWPVQLHLVNPQAAYFRNADLLLTADCVAFALGDFHNKMLKGRRLAVACPKLDDTGPYLEKLTELIKVNDLQSFTVVRMEVPCCTGLMRLAEQAVQNSGVDIDVKEVVVSLKGDIISSEKVCNA